MLFAVGRAWPFLAQSVLVLAGVLLVSRVVLPPCQKMTGTSTMRDVVEGLRWTVQHAAVRTLALTILIFNVTFGAAWSVLVLYSNQRLGLGPVGYGLMSTIGAARFCVGYVVDHDRSRGPNSGGGRIAPSNR